MSLVSQGFGAAKSRSTDLGADGGAFLRSGLSWAASVEELLSGPGQPLQEQAFSAG